MKKITILTVIGILTLVLISGNLFGIKSKNQKDKFDFKDDFYKLTRLIMLKDEIRIYKHLPNEEAKKEFFVDFWKKRDPTPETPENENLEEYERRLAFISKWFKEKIGRNGSLDSDRGKIYLLLGGPDERTTRQISIYDNFGHPKNVLSEIWIYNYYQLRLVFIDVHGHGRYRLNNWSTDLLSAIDRAKFEIHNSSEKHKNFKFKANVKDKALKLDIPVKTLSFAENQNRMNARFKINLFIYKDYKKIGEVEKTKEINTDKDKLLSQKDIELSLPFDVASKGKKGKYLLDIVVEELESGAKYRDMINYKI